MGCIRVVLHAKNSFQLNDAKKILNFLLSFIPITSIRFRMESYSFRKVQQEVRAGYRYLKKKCLFVCLLKRMPVVEIWNDKLEWNRIEISAFDYYSLRLNSRCKVLFPTEKCCFRSTKKFSSDCSFIAFLSVSLNGTWKIVPGKRSSFEQYPAP